MPIFIPFLPFRCRSRYPRTLPDGQLAPSADASAPHRLRQPRPAASLMPAGRTMSVEKKKTEPECGFGAPGTKIETRPLLGVQTEALSGGLVSIFVPGAPNPHS